MTDGTGVDSEEWLATHHEFYSFKFFSQNCFQIKFKEGKFLIFSSGMTPDLLARAYSALYTVQAKSTLFQTPV